MFQKDDSLFCKGFAIVLVLFHHLFNDYGEYAGYTVDYSPFSPDGVTTLALAAKICVGVFLFISGFGIASNWDRLFGDRTPSKNELWSFFWRRYWKLMTGYWFAFLVLLLMQPFGQTLADVYGISKKDGLAFFALDFFGIANFFGTPTLNPTWWYYSRIITFILLAPFIILLMRRYGTILIFAVLTAVACTLEIRNSFFLYIFSFLLGIACYEGDFFRFLEGLGSGQRRLSGCLKLFLELILFFGLCYYHLFASRTSYMLTSIVDGLTALDIALLSTTVLGRLPVLSRLMRFLGKYSSNMFLIHNPLYAFYFTGFFFSFRRWWLITLVLVVVSLAASIAMEYAKKLLRYDVFMQKIGSRIESFLAPDKG